MVFYSRKRSPFAQLHHFGADPPLLLFFQLTVLHGIGHPVFRARSGLCPVLALGSPWNLPSSRRRTKRKLGMSTIGASLPRPPVVFGPVLIIALLHRLPPLISPFLRFGRHVLSFLSKMPRDKSQRGKRSGGLETISATIRYLYYFITICTLDTLAHPGVFSSSRDVERPGENVALRVRGRKLVWPTS